MKRISSISFSIFCLGLLFVNNSVQAKEELRTSELIVVENGQVLFNSIISDYEGNVFLEFLEGTRVFDMTNGVTFDGEILPPEIMGLPGSSPRARMRELFTFNIIGGTDQMLAFADKFELMSEMNKYRIKYFDPENFKRTSMVKVIVPIDSSMTEIGLWEYLGEYQGWQNIGGRLEESSNPDIKIFSAQLKNTGIFTIFDEDPDPSFVPAFPLDSIELAELVPAEFAEGNEFNEVGIYNESDFNDTIYPSESSLDSTLEGGALTGSSVLSGEDGRNSPMSPSYVVPAVTDTQTINEQEVAELPPTAPLIPSTETQTQEPITTTTEEPILYAKYIVCDLAPDSNTTTEAKEFPVPTLDTLPTAENWERPAFMDPTNQVPLTEEQLRMIPPHCKIIIPKADLSASLIIPEDSELPKSGKDEEDNGIFFPLSLLVAVLIIGASGFVAFNKKENY